jgi:hypothetical protein
VVHSRNLLRNTTKHTDSNFIITRGFFDSRDRSLIINEDLIKFENKDLRSNPFTEFSKNEIKEYTYGIKWINGYGFTIGREYQFFIKNQIDEIIKVYFKSFYGYKREKYHQLYQNIFDSLWDNHFARITSKYLELFDKNVPFQIGEVKFTHEYLIIEIDKLISLSASKILWNDVGTRSYQTYFAIFSKLDSLNINRGYSYLDDWNTAVLYSVVNTIIDKGDLSK